MKTQGKMRAEPTYRSLGAHHSTHMSGNMRTYTSGGVVWGDAPPGLSRDRKIKQKT